MFLYSWDLIFNTPPPDGLSDTHISMLGFSFNGFFRIYVKYILGYLLHYAKLDVTHHLPLSTFKNVLHSSGKIPDLLRLDFRPIFHKFLTIDKKRQVLEPDKIIHYITAIYLFCGQENVSFLSLPPVYFQKQDLHKMFFD